MKHFVGRHDKAIDRKGRVLIPATFRAALGDQSRLIFAIPTTDEDRDCKVIWSEARIDQLVDKVSNHFHLMSEEEYNAAQVIISLSTQMTIDENGRVQLPTILIEELGLADTVTFAGDGLFFAMWHPERYEAYLASMLRAGRSKGGHKVMMSLAANSLPAPNPASGDTQGSQP